MTNQYPENFKEEFERAEYYKSLPLEEAVRQLRAKGAMLKMACRILEIDYDKTWRKLNSGKKQSATRLGELGLDRRRKLSAEQICQIKSMFESGSTKKSIAKQFNISLPTVRYYVDDEYKDKTKKALRESARKRGYSYDSKYFLQTKHLKLEKIKENQNK